MKAKHLIDSFAVFVFFISIILLSACTDIVISTIENPIVIKSVRQETFVDGKISFIYEGFNENGSGFSFDSYILDNIYHIGDTLYITDVKPLIK